MTIHPIPPHDSDEPPSEAPPWWADEVQKVVEGEVMPPDVSGDPFAIPPNRIDPEPPLPEPEPADPLPPTREEAAQRLVVIAALEQLVKRLKAEHREQAAGVYDRAHMKDPVLLAGRELGQARTDAVKGGWKVTDPGALAAWVTNEYPDLMVEQVTTVVSPDFIKMMLETMAATGGTVDPVTGEEAAGPPPGVTLVPASHKLVVTAAKDAAQQVTHLFGTAARQLGLPELEAE